MNAEPGLALQVVDLLEELRRDCCSADANVAPQVLGWLLVDSHASVSGPLELWNMGSISAMDNTFVDAQEAPSIWPLGEQMVSCCLQLLRRPSHRQVVDDGMGLSPSRSGCLLVQLQYSSAELQSPHATALPVSVAEDEPVHQLAALVETIHRRGIFIQPVHTSPRQSQLGNSKQSSHFLCPVPGSVGVEEIEVGHLQARIQQVLCLIDAALETPRKPLCALNRLKHACELGLDQQQKSACEHAGKPFTNEDGSDARNHARDSATDDWTSTSCCEATHLVGQLYQMASVDNHRSHFPLQAVNAELDLLAALHCLVR
jgi:hypothetical protein